MQAKARNNHNSKGFALVVVLLLLLVIAGVTLALLLLVNSEGQLGGTDLQHNTAIYKAQGGIEAISSDIIAMYQNKLSPTCDDYANISTMVPSAEYSTFTAIPGTGSTCNIAATYGQITTGGYNGLYAQIIPVTLTVGINRATIGNESAQVSRMIDVALIPSFQFGIFSDSDLSLFNTPDLAFNGRVHTNGSLFLTASSGAVVSFNDKITVFGDVIRTVTPNNLDVTNYSQTGQVNILTTSNGCASSNASSSCRSMATNEGSVSGTSLGALVANPNWTTISKSTYAQNITNASTGAQKLSLPFIQNSSVQPYEIIRRPPAGESTTSTLGASRLYNEAQIRILLSDDPSELPGGVTDPDNVRLANVSNPASLPLANVPFYTNGVPIQGTSNYTYFAEASVGIPRPTTDNTASTLSADWPNAPKELFGTTYATLNAPEVYTGTASGTLNAKLGSAGGTNTASYPYYTVPPLTETRWNLIDGYLRVEYSPGPDALFIGVTREWLQYGFARGLNPPVTTGGNPVHPNGILLFQKLADRTGDGSSNSTGTKATKGTTYALVPDVVTDTNTNSPYFSNGFGTYDATRYNWYPINFYDTREGENRDIADLNPSCTALGVMNAVELDVGNLNNWLLNTTNGKLVDAVSETGYIVYFSDRRGMLKSTYGTPGMAAGNKTGDSGLEDSITVDGQLEPPNTPPINSPEDVNLNGKLDNWGVMNLGAGFYNVSTNINNAILAHNAPYSAVGTAGPTTSLPYISACTDAGKTFVSGARHVLKLVDGTLGNLPTPGFTVASENPVYVQGDYNTNQTDNIWSGGSGVTHSSASIIADAVTLLSNGYTDLSTLNYPRGAGSAASRKATTGNYRMAISAGKNRTFAYKYTDSTLWNYGTDGGIANFLRLLENWHAGPSTLNYEGSMVSLFYSTYATGIFKCCAYSVYEPPTRHYVFDPLFKIYSDLPPGTPMFRLIQMLGYKQIVAARPVGQ